MKCHPSRPPVPEERQINRLHAEAVKKWKDAAEATTKRKRKRKERHDKACKIARAEGKPRPAMPESTDDEEEASDAEAHPPSGGEAAAAGASSPPVYQGDGDEAPAMAEWRSPMPTMGEGVPAPTMSTGGDGSMASTEASAQISSRPQPIPRVIPSDQASRGVGVPRAR